MPHYQQDDSQQFEYAILGAGASAVYFLENAERVSKLKLTKENTVIVGQLQPWAGERGKEGKVNHPIEMIVSRHESIKEHNGLATRKAFSDYIQDELNKWPHKDDSYIKKVRLNEKGEYYEIFTSKEGKEQTFEARNVVVALGIGKHKEPKIEWDGEKHNDTNMVVKEKKIPKVMDMDQFQRVMEEGVLDINSLKSIAVVGPNAPIDVMTTLLRKRGQQTSPTIHWIIGWKTEKPFFLKGTNNEYVEQVYDQLEKDALDQRILSGVGISVYRYDCLNIKVTPDKVEVKVGEREKEQRVEARKLETEIVVYGIGPDVRAVLSIFEPPLSNDTLEPEYDKNMHFNNDSEEINEQQIKTAIKEFRVPKNKKKPPLTEEKATEKAKQIILILGDLKLAREKDELPRLVPPVIGLINKEQENEKATLRIIGGAAYRIASDLDIKYQYVSHMLKRLENEGLKELKTCEREKTTDENEKNINEFVKQLKTYIDNALSLAKLIEESESEKKKEETKEYRNKISNTLEILKQLQEKIKYIIKGDKNPNQESKKVAGAYRLAKNYYEMLEEQHEKVVKEAEKKVLATTFMLPVIYTLPINVAIGDQLTAILCVIAAGQNSLTAYIVDKEDKKEVNFIIANQTDIQNYIAMKYDIPPKIANYIPERIIYERRHSPLHQAPIPRPKEGSERLEEMTLQQMSNFQKRWKENIQKIHKIVNE